jgi:heme o synthase
MIRIPRNFAFRSGTFTYKPKQIFSLNSSSPNKPTRKMPIWARDLLEVTKFKLSLSNTLVAYSGYLLYNPSISTETISFLVATQLIAMSSQTANQRVEKEFDKLMIRTCNRPLPKNRITNQQAYAIAFSLYLSSNLIYYNCFPLPALGVANFIYLTYVYVYTPFKRKDQVNTALGAIFGSVTPYLGWAAAGGSLLSPDPFFLTFFMFSWQFSHFYGILWLYKEDYKRAGFIMMEDANKAAEHLKLCLFGAVVSSWWVCGGLTSLNHYYLLQSLMTWLLYKYSWLPILEFQKEPGSKTARRLKKCSYIYMSVLFTLVFLDSGVKIWRKREIKEIENNKTLVEKA